MQYLINFTGKQPNKNLFSKSNVMASAGAKANLSFSDLPECPVCLNTITEAPVFLCAGGHELCATCRGKLKDAGQSCPVCKEELLDVRNRALEKLLDKLPKICKHDGCNFARSGGLSDAQVVKDHEEKECRQRQDCFFTDFC